MPTRVGYRLALFWLAVLALSIVVLLPLVIISAFDEITAPPSHRLYRLTSAGTNAAPTRSYLHVDLTAVNEWAHTATLRVSGNHICDTPCNWSDQVLLVSIFASDYGTGGLPPFQTLTFSQAEQEVAQDIVLPISGEPTRYPFDSYRLDLGIIQRRLYQDGSTQTLSTTDAQGHLFLTMHAEAPRIRVQSAVPIAPQTIASIGPQYSYASVSRLTLERPLTIRILAIELILLVSAAATFAVVLQPLHILLVNIGGVILGIWGIRAILLGPDVNGLTSIDFSLSMVLIFLLAALTVRILLYAKRHGGLSSREK